MDYKSTSSTDEPDLCRVQEGNQDRSPVRLEAEGIKASSQGRYYTHGESTS